MKRSKFKQLNKIGQLSEYRNKPKGELWGVNKKKRMEMLNEVK